MREAFQFVVGPPYLTFLRFNLVRSLILVRLPNLIPGNGNKIAFRRPDLLIAIIVIIGTVVIVIIAIFNLMLPPRTTSSDGYISSLYRCPVLHIYNVDGVSSTIAT